MLRLLLVLSALLLPVKVNAENIVILGDSLSAGYGIPLTDSWPELLRSRLSQMGHVYDVINASISGETATGGRNRLPELLTEWHPKILILELGANDGLRGAPIVSIRDDLDYIISHSLAEGTDVVLVGVLLPPNYGAHYTRKFRDVYTELAKRYALHFLPFILDGIHGQPELMLDDRLHPSSLAQPMILDNLWPVLAPLLNHD
jgi:acyl-CoA thioesterase-1